MFGAALREGATKKRVAGTPDEPYGEVASVRMILAGIGPKGQWHVICRMGAKGKKVGGPGGKLKHAENMIACVHREGTEETHIKEIFGLSFFTQLHVPGRVIEYPVEKYEELGYLLPRGYTHVWLSNSIINFFTAYTAEKLTEEKPEGREVMWIDLSPGPAQKTQLKKIKAHHRMVYKLWLKSKETGTRPPGYVVYMPD